MRKKCLLAAALLVWGGGALAQGRGDSPRTTGKGAARPETSETGADSLRTIQINPVSVSAFRAGERTPVAHTNFSREEISRTVGSGADIPFLLTATPSVVATSDAGTGIGYTSVSIRGTDGTRINVTANGVPLGDGESHRLYWVNVPDFAASASGIQIQRGVGTSTNGAGAFGGSINMATEPLSPTPFAELSATYGSWGTHRESVRWGTGLVGDRWAFGGRLSNIGSDGYVDRASADLKSYFVQAGWFGRTTTMKLLSFGGHEATYHAWNGLTAGQIKELGRRYNTAGEIWKGDRVTGFYPDQKDFYTQYHVQLIADQRLSERWNLNLTGHYTRGDGYYEEYKGSRTLSEYGLAPYLIPDPGVPGATLEAAKSDLIRRKKMWNNFGGAMASAAYTGERLDAALGAAWNRYGGDHFGQVVWVKNYVGELAPNHEYYRNTSVKNDASLFAKASWTVARGLSIYGDVQFRHISHRIDGTNDVYDWREGVQAMQTLDVARTYDFFNPKVGVYYDINPDGAASSHAVYASLAVAHKEPTRDNYTEAKFDATPRAERLLDWEAGYKFAHRKVSASANIYYMRYKDQLVPTGEMNDIGEAMAENVPRSYRAGIELTAGWQVAKWFRWDIFGTFSRNRVTLGKGAGSDAGSGSGDADLAYSPPVVAGNIFTFNAGGFYGALQANYVGRQYVTNSGNAELTLSAYCVTTLRAGYRVTRHLELGVTVNNLFDARYSSFGYDLYGEVAYFPQATVGALGHITLSF